MVLSIHIQPKGIDIEHQPGSTLLESALAAGITLPHSCDAGSCEVCTAKLIAGSVNIISNTAQHTLNAATNPQVSFLCCRAIPLTDCVLEINNVLAKGELPLFTVACQVQDITPLSHDVTRYLLKLPAGKKVQYHAGQYLELVVENNGEESVFPFSIGNAQRKDRIIELHIRDVPNSESLELLKSHLNVGSVINARLPKGDCTLAHLFPNNELSETTDTPLIFLAGSTGFAPVKAMIEAYITQGLKRPVYLYWGGRTADDIYLHETAQQWHEEYSQFTYIPVVSEPESNTSWQGRTGFVHKAVMEDFTPFDKDLCIIAGGSPGMVHAAYDDFIAAGLNKSQLHSDVFAYAPK